MEEFQIDCTDKDCLSCEIYDDCQKRFSGGSVGLSVILLFIMGLLAGGIVLIFG